jgi:hypothetical protein
VPLIGDLDMVANQELHLHSRAHTCFVYSGHSPSRDLGVSLAIVSPYKPQTKGLVRAHP